ncbi:unnamed protein product [Leptidea sinapis]|uniref:Uncharacterized protein n=1 Tax=Leptidea sinapis TaxID=189913 RepID=A0A5E4PV98_9NEOP|nr:unnamed protein product [Leptidea sinapis]
MGEKSPEDEALVVELIPLCAAFVYKAFVLFNFYSEGNRMCSARALRRTHAHDRVAGGPVYVAEGYGGTTVHVAAEGRRRRERAAGRPRQEPARAH